VFTVGRLVELVRAEYRALPTLKLTREQACRLWSVDAETCAGAMEILVTEGLLHKTGTGKYVALPRPAGVAVLVDEDRLSPALSIRCPHCSKRNAIDQSQVILGRGLALTVRCVGCQRIISLSEESA
jgi:predicted Zn finger-like uncharacterized protein